MSLRSFYFLLLFLTSSQIYAQQESGFHIERLGPKDGLSHRWTLCVHQDAKGYIWIGTYDGLNRYDGKEFISFRPSAGGKLPIEADLIYKIIEDVNGKLYLESRYGLLKFDPKTEVFELINTVDKVNGAIIYTTDNSGHFVATLYNYTIAKGNYFTLYELNNSGNLILKSKIKITAEVPINSLPVTCDKDRIWFWDFSGSYLRLDFKTNSWEKISIPGSKEIPLDNTGIFHYPDADQLESLSLPTEIKNGKCLSIEPGKAIWIYVEKEQTYTLYRYDLKAKKLKVAFPNIPAADINFLSHQSMSPSFYLDRESTVWCGGFLGLSKIRSTNNLFRNIMAKPVKSIDAPPSGASIRSITEDANGDIYFIGNYSSSLNKLSTKTGNLKQINLPLISTGNPYFQDYIKNGVIPAFSLLSDKEANIWITSVLGLFRYNIQTEKFQYYTTISENLPYVFGDYHGKLIFWQSGKIYLLDKISGKFTEGPELQIGEYQIPLIQEKENLLWAITDTGLIRFNLPDYKPQKIKLYTKPREQRCIIYHNGYLWIGTSRGLEKVNPKTFEHTNFDRSKGLPGNFVYSVIGDGDYLWLGTSDGLCRFSVATGAVKNFYVEDGLSHNEFNTLSAYKARNGMIYMGGLNGINAFFPKDLEGKTTIKSNVLLSRFSLFDTKRDSLIYINTNTLPDKIRLSPSETSFNIHLALNNYIDPGKNQFAWKLEGLDQDWFYAGNQNIANYRYVPPGHYTFKAKAADSFGNWTEQELVLKLIVSGPWYNRWWAWLIYLILLSGAAIVLYRFQLSKKLDHAENLRLQSLDEFKNRFFTNITHEFRTPLTVILGMSGKLQEADTESGKPLEPAKSKAVSLIKRNAESLLRLINQILDLAKLESHSLKLNYIQGDVLPYLRYITESLQSFANTQNILLRVETSESQIVMDYDPERLLQTLHNLLSNAIKFTPNGGKVILTIKQDEKGLKGKPALFIQVEGYRSWYTGR